MIACTSLGDKELLQLLQQDNELAFRELYNHYWDQLFYLAHKRLKSAAAAEEIVQDVFLTLWKKRKDLAIESLPAYLAAMTRHAVYRYLAREKRKSEKYSMLSRQSAKTLSEEPLIDSKITLEIIRKLTNKLPEKCRLVFIYNKIDDLSLPEVAQKLKISLKTAEAHLTKALRLIRTSFGNFLFILVHCCTLFF